MAAKKNRNTSARVDDPASRLYRALASTVVFASLLDCDDVGVSQRFIRVADLDSADAGQRFPDAPQCPFDRPAVTPSDAPESLGRAIAGTEC